MPNHCQNYLVLSHPDVRQIGRAKLAILEEKLFSEFVPCPEALLRPGAASHGGPNADEYEKIREHLDVSIIGHMTDPTSGINMVTKSGSSIPLKAQGWDALMKR